MSKFGVEVCFPNQSNSFLLSISVQFSSLGLLAIETILLYYYITIFDLPYHIMYYYVYYYYFYILYLYVVLLLLLILYVLFAFIYFYTLLYYILYIYIRYLYYIAIIDYNICVYIIIYFTIY